MPASASIGLAPRVAAFAAHLRAHATATEALALWCAARFPGPSSIQAEVLADQEIAASVYAGPLHPAPGEPIRHRRVHLVWGRMIVSEADNWYLPARLPPAIAASLLSTTTPFGAAIRPLHPKREITRVIRGATIDTILRLEAIVTISNHVSVAEVHERYRPSLLD